MRLLKWLFQPAYLLLIIVLVALYVNRETLFSQNVAESLEAEELVAKVEDLAGRLRSESQGEASTVTEPEEGVQGETSQPVDTVAVAEPPAAVEETLAEVEQGPAPAEADATAMAAAVADAAPLSHPEEAPTAGEAREIETPAPVPESPAEPAAEPLAAEVESALSAAPALPQPAAEAPPAPTEAAELPQGSEPPPQVESQSPLAVWYAARAAVWQGDLEGGVAQYRALIALQPDNFDAYGEMGNVLLAQSNVAAAVEAYATAARLIHQAGHRQMAWQVAGIVAQLDKERGRALYEEFSR